MALVCPSCDHPPEPTAQAGRPCTACGATLVRVDDRDPLIGTVLDGRFKIVERLGAGAMGVVYRATQLSIGRDVAVKVIGGMDTLAVKRFFREAKIASTLSHPNTVQIIEFGQGSEGRIYLAMELVRGRTLLEEVASTGAIASRRLCHIGVQLCDALEAAHKLGIVHRDLKPENVMIATDGTDHVKILDFGIARVLGDVDSRVTSAGLSAGTPNYMAPEVLGEGAEPQPPQDLYALGVMLGELAIGSSMWTKTSLEHLFVEKTLNQAPERVPPRLRPLVRQLMDPDPARRPSAAETRKVLRQLDRTATDPVGVAATASLLPLGAPAPDGAAAIDLAPMGELAVVDLGEHTGVPVPALPASFGPPLEPSSFEPPPAPAAPTLETLHPDVVNLAASDQKLELDSGWERERNRRVGPSQAAKRVAAEAIRPPVAKRSSGAWSIVVLLVLGGLAVAGYYVFVRKPAPAPARIMPDRGVTIRIVGADGTAITIDGKPAGKTPLSLQRRPGTKKLVIGANGSTWPVIPDHDQTIDVTQP